MLNNNDAVEDWTRCEFDRASSLIRGNKKGQLDSTDGSLLQNLFFVQHVSGTIMPIIRSSRVLYRWLLPVVLCALVYRLLVQCVVVSYVSGLPDAALATHESPWWRVCGKNLNIVSMCAVSPVVNTSNISSCQKKNFSSFPVAVINANKVCPLVLSL